MEKSAVKKDYKDTFQNGASVAMTEKTLKSNSKENYISASVKKKDSQKIPPIDEPDLANPKCKVKKKKPSKTIDESSNSSFSPKHSKGTKKLQREVSLESSDLAMKLNSFDNMRKPVRQDRRASVPNDSPGFKTHSNSSFNYSPKPTKNVSQSPKSDSKFRSKTPDVKGASGYTPGKKCNPAKRGLKFEPYIPLSQVQQGLKRGEFIEGALRINPRNYEDAYISSPDGSMDIYISGMHNRNRALNGDTVVVQVNPKQEWKILCDAIKDYQEKNGKTFMETICQPASPAGSCKVHTPDPFVRPRPFSSNSWDGASRRRSPDTLEILGVDKLGQHFEGISIQPKLSPKPKGKLKRKATKQTESNSQQSSTASYSQESSEDCLDKMSPDQYFVEDVVDGHISQSIYTENQNSSEIKNESKNGMLPENTLIQKVNSNCAMEEIGEFQNEDCKDSNWVNNENSLNIVISPEELLQIDENSILNHSDLHEQGFDDSCSESGGVVVPPGELSGDEFTDSASISGDSDHLEKVIEDSAFLASQQDTHNNNIEILPQNIGNVANFSFTQDLIPHATSGTVENSLDTHCRMQFNRSIPKMVFVDNDNAEVITSNLSEVFPENESIQQDIVLHNINTKDVLTSNINNNVNEITQNTNKRKTRQRKKKKKLGLSETQSLNEKISSIVQTFNDIHNLTVDQIMEHPDWTKYVQKTGKVVHILERKHSCLTSGHLKLMPDRNVKWALFSPNDSRVPRVMVPMYDCPQNFYHRSQDYANVLFLAEIIKWDEQSTYASGHLVKELGNTGDIEAETEGILIENSVDFQEFDEDVLACLPQEDDWSVPVKELKNRRDFRQQCVFTIDPSTARDMDDAVSCALLKNGNYEVGVHIADVSYFVQEDTKLDKIAAERATSVYLVQKVIPMLPRRLCDELCSLNPGKDRLTYSAVWEMSTEGEIFNQWIGRSVINSCLKLSYEHAQDMIENPARTWNVNEHPPMYGNFTIYDVIKRVNELHFLAVKLRDKRFMEGALHLNQVKLQFTINPESNLPSGFNVYVQKDSNKLIEEFMLLANMTVASTIFNSFPSLALLRRHPPPEMKPMNDVVEMCETVGIILDTTTSGTLQSSIARYNGDSYLSSATVQVLMNLCSKPMNCALYFCSGVLNDERLYRHYALNVPLYTHFTSPIRRYPDIIVHRLLGAALGYNKLPDMSAVEMQKCATHCNDKKYNAKRVSDLSLELFLAAFIRNLGRVAARAMVVNVMDHSFDCLILEMGIIKRVYCDKLPLVKKEYNRNQGLSVLNMIWKDDSVKEGIRQTIVVFTLIDVVMKVDENSLQIKVVLTKPEK